MKRSAGHSSSARISNTSALEHFATDPTPGVLEVLVFFFRLLSARSTKNIHYRTEHSFPPNFFDAGDVKQDADR